MFVNKLERGRKKKLITFLSGIIFLMILAACTPIPFSYDYSILYSTVVRVELVYYDQPAVRQVSDLFGNAHRHHLDFDFELMEYIKTLNENYHGDLFEDLSSFEMQNAINQNNSPSGLTILLQYENGDFDVFSSLYVGRFSFEGEFIEFLGDGLWSEPFEELVEYFFDFEWE